MLSQSEYNALPVQKIKSTIENHAGSSKWDWQALDKIAQGQGRSPLCYSCSSDAHALIQFLYDRIKDYERTTTPTK